ncbi:MAG: hypothetical protein ACO26C_06110, partial [Ilumatobacteraceae bacterium]
AKFDAAHGCGFDLYAMDWLTLCDRVYQLTAALQQCRTFIWMCENYIRNEHPPRIDIDSGMLEKIDRVLNGEVQPPCD